MNSIGSTCTKFFAALAVGLSLCLWACVSAVGGEPPRFNRDVRPILSKNCFACHGPDQHSREGGFRLDIRESALANADSGARPIVPSEAEASELLQRIGTNNAKERMPPQPHEPLNAAEQETLRRWIEDGATYEQHWSFERPRRIAPPPVKHATWPRNMIDYFVLAQLERAGLNPAPEASRETLIRRATLDLTGLPATPEAVDAFLRDSRENAYESVVDQLMSTTAYAERRAQDWLDLARYADTRGFADDNPRQIWPWRDWVIRAIDGNMPFDQFTIEQLAGDMLPQASDEQRLATAFHRNAPQARGNTYPTEEYRLKGVVDRVNTTGRVWLGLTVGCAECHDHKFDPVTQRDYYALFAIFNNIEHSGEGFAQGGPTMQYTHRSVKHARERAQLLAEITAAQQDLPPLRLPTGDDKLLGKWTGPEVLSSADQIQLSGDFVITAKIRTKLSVANIVSKYDWRDKQRSYVFGLGAEGERQGTPGHLFAWISAQPHPFTGVSIYGSQRLNDGREHEVALAFSAGKSVRLFVNGVEDNGAQIVGDVPTSIAQSNRRLVIGAGYSGATEPHAYRFEDGLKDVRIYDTALEEDGAFSESRERVARLRAALTKLDEQSKATAISVSNVPVMREMTAPRQTFIHLRGNFLQRGDEVSPAVPTVFAVEGGRQPGNRLEFARWLVDEQNPLVARVAVNRFWQSHFGHGLVRTPDDFGAQGSPPTHPELLDWLASEFIASGWDMKRMHRLMVTSAAYRQSARLTTELRQRDPENLLLARMSRMRLPAEQIRDQALAASGLLVPRVGGPPVFPLQPDGYWQQRALPGEWKNGIGEDRHRRTIYTYWRRMALHPALELLDAPARDMCVVRRDNSNVPTQALVLLNDPMFLEAAGGLAARLIREVDEDDEARLERAFRLVLGRAPDDAERARFLDYLLRQRQSVPVDAQSAQATDATEQGVWTLTCSVLLNLDEAITRP